MNVVVRGIALLLVVTGVVMALAFLIGGKNTPFVGQSGVPIRTGTREGGEVSGPDASGIRIPIGSGETSRGVSAETEPFKTVRVAVNDEYGQAISGSQVTIASGLGPVIENSGVTDVRGECTFKITSPTNALLYLKAAASGFATHLVSHDPAANTLALSSPGAYFEIVLANAVVLTVAVIDDAQVPLQSHIVHLRYLGKGAEPSESGSRKAGVQAAASGVTDHRGEFVSTDLAEGWWLASCDRWRDKSEGQHTPVYVKILEPAHVVVTVQSMPLDRYASGYVVVPMPAPRLSEFKTIDQFSVMVEGRGPVAHWLYEGGQFFVYGEPDQIMEARVASRDGRVLSDAFALRIGRHDYRIPLN